MALLSILFLTSAHNSMSQKAFLELSELGHKVHVELAHSESHMVAVFDMVKPDIVVCPFLTKKVPEAIWSKVPTLIVHPGIMGDRGASSLDYALSDNVEEWGVTILQAVEEMDAGDIYSSVNFSTARGNINTLTKSSLYKNEVITAAIDGLKRAIFMITHDIKPVPLNYDNPSVKGRKRPTMKLSDRKIRWEDSAENIARVVRAADGRPGVPSTVGDVPVYLHGAHIELHLNKDQKYTPGQLIAKRNEAVCVACGNGTALWFTALRRVNDGASMFFKLPALYALPSSATDELPESKLPLEGAPTGTWKEIWTNTTNGVCYLHSNFHNGAMHTKQCKRLVSAIQEVAAVESTKVIVLMGGHDYFSNGIHLNVIEAAQDSEQESWDNINAIDDVVLAIMSIKDKVTVSAMQGNAGAGGVMMALASDYVYMGTHVVLNPHYKAMHLYGSEYWTYNLPKRVGAAMATELTEGMQPISASHAIKIGLVDDAFGANFDEFTTILEERMAQLSSLEQVTQIVTKKQSERNEEFFAQLQKARELELSAMKLNFSDPLYDSARSRFVNKETCACTPKHFPKIARTPRCNDTLTL